ncbi:unnamed protein product [Lactuca virosa]|uniref:Uncharacterized protein n=1 Tax=Lactuca virosa TaxID=75947 RepID=A0AAU9MA91_9ASTR|nr:unnamed protein product [Lactuca virosa]
MLKGRCRILLQVHDFQQTAIHQWKKKEFINGEENELLNEEASSSCSPAQICMKKLQFQEELGKVTNGSGIGKGKIKSLGGGNSCN